MRNWQAPPAAGPAPPVGQDLLFTPGPRLGWVFRDRRELAVPYPEPEPSPHAIQEDAAARIDAAEQAWQRTWKWVGKPSIGLALLLVVLAGCARSASGNFSLGLTAVTFVALCGPGFAWTGWQWLRREQARDVTPEQEYHQAVADWYQRATWHEAAELARLTAVPEWGSANVPARRTDVFGGTLAGWQALLTVHGASLLASRPLLAIDLTGHHAATMLTAAAQRTGIPAAVYRLPHDLGRCGMLAELSPAQLAGAIAEALHAGVPGGARTDRAIDVRVLQQLAGALASGGVTPQRLAAAVRAALGHAIPGGILSGGEQELLTGDLFPAGYREQIGASLVRLDAVMAELAAYASDGWPAEPGRYTCLTLDGGPRTALGEVLTALIAQWLTVQVSGAGQEPPAVLIAGADEITRRQLEHLADACEARRVPVTLLFRHLREDAASVLGGGTTAFMRLGNHAEAEQAAAYIGRRHTFVVSSFTATRGGWSQSGGAYRSETETRQRVCGYAVEPAALQNLPDCALLLADRAGETLRLHAVECDPAIITLPGASTAPLPLPGSIPPALPDTMDPAGPAIDAAGQYQAEWQEPAAEEPDPDWPPEEQPPDPPWWERNG
jgi:hypothetical protein